MAGTSSDMTAPRTTGASPVYAIYGEPDLTALTMTALHDSGTRLVQVPLDVLTALETGSPTMRDPALDQVQRHHGLDLVGAVGFDDWWTTALTALNPGFPLSDARTLVTDKALLYKALNAHHVPTGDFTVGWLSLRFLTEAVRDFGPRLMLKPVTGAGSRGVYRYRDELSVEDNFALYQQLRRLGNIDTSVPTIAAQYLGGDAALEISADVIVCQQRISHTVVHEKLSATQAHPFVDHIMTSPPIHPDITGALGHLPDVLQGVITAVAITYGVLHVELRLHEQRWHVLDVGVRPGAGLVAHAALARTGVDPRRAHLGACLGRPLTAASLSTATGPRHAATCIACCYIAPGDRDQVRLRQQADLADTLRAEPAVFGWHLNASEIVDDVYRPDAGLSIGVGASDPAAAMRQLRSLTEPYAYSTE